jgi:hypothetical protein
MLHMRVGSILYTKSMLLFLCYGPQCCGVFVCHGRCKRFWVSVLFSAVKSNIPNTPHMCKYLYIYIKLFISRYEVQLSQTWYWSTAVSMMPRLEQQLSIAKRLVCASRIWLATTWRFVVSVWHNMSMEWGQTERDEESPYWKRPSQRILGMSAVASFKASKWLETTCHRLSMFSHRKASRRIPSTWQVDYAVPCPENLRRAVKTWGHLQQTVYILYMYICICNPLTLPLDHCTNSMQHVQQRLLVCALTKLALWIWGFVLSHF